MNAMIRNVLAKPVEFDLRNQDDSLLAQHDRYFSTVLADLTGIA